MSISDEQVLEDAQELVLELVADFSGKNPSQQAMLENLDDAQRIFKVAIQVLEEMLEPAPTIH